ncbi:ABC transporter permease [Amycolatopsis australiensis]|nr:ABC transporter permease [Amycolatopsis australiensis]
MLRNDIEAGVRHWRQFLARTLLLPPSVLFVFGRLLPDLGYVSGGYANVLFPGLVAASAFIGALHGTALPLAVDFSWTREIENRLLAPLDTRLIALEKVLLGALRGLLSAALVVPAGFVALGGVQWPLASAPAASGILLLGALTGAATGLALGSLVTPCRVMTVFGAALPPLAFTGCIHFPLDRLAGIPWFRAVCAVNPLTYVAEGLRAALLPDEAAITVLPAIAVLTGVLAVAGLAGVLGFHRRAHA